MSFVSVFHNRQHTESRTLWPSHWTSLWTVGWGSALWLPRSVLFELFKCVSAAVLQKKGGFSYWNTKTIELMSGLMNAFYFVQGAGQENTGIYIKCIVKGGPAEMVRFNIFARMGYAVYKIIRWNYTRVAWTSKIFAEREVNRWGPAAECGWSKCDRPQPRKVCDQQDFVPLDC